MRIRGLRALAAAALLAAMPALGQPAAARWNTAPGLARDLAVAPSGEVHAVGPQGDLWRWRANAGAWDPVPGQVARISGGTADGLWAIAPDGTVMRLAPGGWERFPQLARDIAAGPGGEAVIARTDGGLARWRPDRRDWEPLPGRGHRLALHADGSIWTVAEDGSIARHDAQGAHPVPGRARDIAAAGRTVMIAAADGSLQRLNAEGTGWDTAIEGDFTVVGVSATGTAWAARADGGILTQAPVPQALALSAPPAAAGADGVTFSRRGRPAPGTAAARLAAARARAAAAVVLKPPARTTDPAPFEFIDTLGTASRLAIGQDGSVFAIGLDGGLARWSNARRAFVAFPGSLVRIAVDPGGNPWGINQAGRIFRHTGTDWRQVRGAGSDIALAAGGAAMVAGASGALSRFDAPSESFLPVPGELYFIALEADGTPWGLLKDGSVLRCAALPCERAGQAARSLAVGPDDSVFIVTAARELRRFNRDTRQFEFIPVPGHEPASVAVGPFGRPWVVTTAGRVLSSRFFARDEGVDLQTAATTVTPTIGSGDVAAVLGATQGGSGFSFSKNLQFDAIANTCGLLDDVIVGADGTVLIQCDFGARLLRFNSAGKTFSDVTALPTSAMGPVDVDPDGRLWIADNSVAGRIHRQRQKNGSGYDVLQVPVAGGGFAPFEHRDLAIGPDGTTYFIDHNGVLYRKTIAQSAFSKMLNGNFRRVAVGVANDVWLLDASALYQLVGGRLERRPASGSPVTLDIGGGADGSIYAVQLYPSDAAATLYKWNPNNQSFDRVNRTANHVDVTPSGRPWITDTSNSPDAFVAR